QQQQEQEQERSPERFARSSLNADVIDLTRGTQEEYTDLYFAARHDLGFRVASSGSLASTRTAAVSRPRPRLGALNSPNIAAFEEYTARAQAARGAASNQFAYDDDSARAPHGGAGSLGGREIDPDNMTYDELLRLGEQNGDVKKERWRQMAVQVISCLPMHRWRGGGNNSDASFAENDRALSLPCAHVFHEECVDGWIRENNSCPLCKLEIVPM
ncbi:hypothetical protein PybrP1_009124, partial [[Pythium] brassicae (nom. inval.)]